MLLANIRIDWKLDMQTATATRFMPGNGRPAPCGEISMSDMPLSNADPYRLLQFSHEQLYPRTARTPRLAAGTVRTAFSAEKDW